LDEALSALASENEISAGRVEFIKTGEWPPCYNTIAKDSVGEG